MASGKAREYELPHVREGWADTRARLLQLADKTARGLAEFERIYKECDRWDSVRPPLDSLRAVLSEAGHVTEELFCETLLPWLARAALRVEDLFRTTDGKLTLMPIGFAGGVVLTRLQACCLLALAFLNLLPPVTSVSRQHSPSGSYQQLTLAAILTVGFYRSQRTKLLCLLGYFRRVMEAEEAEEEEFLSMRITVERRQLQGDQREAWKECETTLSVFEQPADGLIEDAHGSLQVDFANEYIGGGVLGMGNVQEEIRFVISPECLVSLLLCERMERYEAILISGAEQFSSYSGYGTRFKYTGPVADPNPVSPDNQRCVSIVAIDAIPYSFSGDTDQFGKENLLLELNKAFCGFSFITPLDEALHDKWVPVATGNWGCGAFGGNKELKTLLQWMAASRARRTIRYYSFNGDGDLQTRQREVVECLRACGTTVGQLYGILRAGGLARGAVFEEVMRAARALAG